MYHSACPPNSISVQNWGSAYNQGPVLRDQSVQMQLTSVN